MGQYRVSSDRASSRRPRHHHVRTRIQFRESTQRENESIRLIASSTDLSAGTAYDLVEALYSILDLGDNESSPTTYKPDDFDEDEGDLLGEFDDE